MDIVIFLKKRENSDSDTSNPDNLLVQGAFLLQATA